MARVLLIDDDQFIRDINADVLTAEGHSVTLGVDGEDAYAKMKSGQFDLVLLDVILPKMTGFDVVKKIKQEIPNYASKIIFLTNSDEAKDKNEAAALGGSYALKSALTPPDLVALVNTALPQQTS